MTTSTSCMFPAGRNKVGVHRTITSSLTTITAYCNTHHSKLHQAAVLVEHFGAHQGADVFFSISFLCMPIWRSATVNTGESPELCVYAIILQWLWESPELCVYAIMIQWL